MDVEKLLRIPIADLKLLRITCPKCQAAVEMPLDQVSKRLRSTDCAFCNEQLFAHDRPTAAGQFAQAVLEILREGESVHIELVVPAAED